MAAVVDVVLPDFSIMLAGYLAGRFRLLGSPSSEALNRFVFFIALPALFFVSMARVEIGEAFHGPFLLAFGGGTPGSAVSVGALMFPNRLAARGLLAFPRPFRTPDTSAFRCC
jgi:hypothetical protein